MYCFNGLIYTSKLLQDSPIIWTLLVFVGDGLVSVELSTSK